MKHEKNEDNSKATSSRAMNNMAELIEIQAARINTMEQQFLELASRVSSIEGPPKFRNQ